MAGEEVGVSTPMMNSSDKIDQVVAALVAAQVKMPTVSKTKTNPFFKSKYADLTTVVEAVKPHLGEHGLGVTQFVSHDEDRTTLKTYLVHSSGQWIGDEMILHLTKNSAQDQGSAVTYARRYAYCSVLGIVSDDDDDGNAASRPAASTSEESSGGQTTRVRSPQPQASAQDDGKPKMNRLFALLNGRKDIASDDDSRHHWATEVLGKPVESFTDLTNNDVKTLEQWFKGNAAPSKQHDDDDPERPF